MERTISISSDEEDSGSSNKDVITIDDNIFDNTHNFREVSLISNNANDKHKTSGILKRDKQIDIEPPKKRLKLTNISPSADNVKTIEIEPPVILIDEDESNMDLAMSKQSIDKNNIIGNNNCDPIQPSCSASHTVIETKRNLLKLIKNCEKTITSDEKKLKFSKSVDLMWSFFDSIVTQKKSLENINKLLEEKLANYLKEPIISFNDIFMELKNLKNVLISDEKTKKKLKILWKKLHEVNKMIKKLDEREVDWDDDENSVYIQRDRYQNRAVKIYKFICKLSKTNSVKISMLQNKLDISPSKYTEINQALRRKFPNASKFPDYPEVLKCIVKCVESCSLKLPQSEIEYEARKCFKKIGEAIKKMRCYDLKVSMMSYLKDSDTDIAEVDSELCTKLQNSAKKIETETEAIIENYVRLQELGANPNISSDSSDSNYEESEED